MAKKLWVEEYRPTTINDYVFRDDTQKKQVESWVNDKSIPHLLFSGSAGIGKTTLAKVLINELGVDPGDVLQINGSTENGVEYIRDTITNFVSIMPFGDMRCVLLDEADYLSPNAQAALRGVTEQFSDTARFILTCNYPERLIPPLKSRFQGFHIESLDKDQFILRIANILLEKNVSFDADILNMYIESSYPDMRKCINNIQMNVVNDELLNPVAQDNQGTADYMAKAIAYFRDGKYNLARKVICKEASPEEYDSLFTFMYRNLDIWAGDDDQEKENQAIVIIRNGMAKAPLCADPEINISAVLCELEMIASQ